jgi:pimeloyl-ACP methyl ester carboxylesterase
VSETGHADIVDFDASVAGQRRRDRFREALGEPIEKLRSRYAEDTRRVREEQFQRTDHVVFVLHGIRDTGGWRAALAEKIEALGKGEVTVRRPAYPFFPMAPFLLANRRQRFVRMFVDWYTEALTNYPRAKVSFVGHSNGTYMAARALLQYGAVRLHRVVFAGSVVPRSYPWDRIIEQQHRVTAVRNYLASADWVVAIFPRLFELVAELTGLRSFGIGDIGSAGFDGFLDATGNQGEVRVAGRHSAAVAPRHHEDIAAFVVTGARAATGAALPPSALVSLASRLCWLVWLALLAAVAVALWFGAPWIAALLGVSAPLVAIGLGLLLLLLLNTV